MFKKNKIRVVPVHEYTDFSEREKRFNEMRYATQKDVAVMGIVPSVAVASLISYEKTKEAGQMLEASYQMVNPVPDVPPATLPGAQPDVVIEGAVQTGYIADKSLEMLATILDPFIDIMVAISFPIASVIMVGACFFFMIGNQEKAWTMIMNSALGYILIQLSPLFLDILRTLGNTV